MDSNIYTSVLPLIGVVTAIGGAVYTILKILREIRKSKKAEADRIIDECKELDLVLKAKLEAKLSLLETQLHNLELNVAKDFSSMKESHTLELRNLGDKIESLRDEFRTQSVGILNLLTKLVQK